MRRIRTLLIAAILPFALAAEAHAFCWVTSNSVAFGAYDVFSPTPTDTTGRIRILCIFEPASNAEIAIGQSPTSGRFIPRQMGSAADRMDYNLFTDSTCTQVWGDGTGGTSSVIRPIGGGIFRITNVPVYGRIPPQQDVGLGVYSDSVTITVNW